MAKEQLVFAFHEEKIYSFERAEKYTFSYFGGPLEDHVYGIDHGPRPLHKLACLNGNELPLLRPHHYMNDLPLIYGLSYSGCDIEYEVKSGSLKLLDLLPKNSSEGFPYHNYPIMLPFLPLRVSNVRASTYEKFADRFPNMKEEQPAELVVAIPPPATVGISIWGRWGDPEGVTVVFECNLKDRKVRAYNVCD